MAANYITIGSKFQPFSFAEMLQPLQIYGQEYQRQEDLYNNYAETAGLIGSDLNETLDADIIDSVYNPYMKDLSSAAAALSEKGLSPDSRKNLQELRRRFGREITPIKMASEARAKARDNWDKMLASDKSLMTNANPYYLGISSYMNGKSPETSYVSGNELYQRGMNLSKAFSQTMRNVPSDRRSVLQGQYWEIAKQFGANSEEMNQFMQGVIKSIPALGEQVDDIMNASGIYQDGFTNQDINKAYQYIVEGMKAGLSGNTEVQYLANAGYKPAEDPEDSNIPQQTTTTLGFVPIDSKKKDFARVALKDKVDSYETINFNNEDILVEPLLKAAYFYHSNPEFKSEYDALRQEGIDKINEQYVTKEGTLNDPEGYAREIKKFNDLYPEIPRLDKIKKQIEKQMKENSKTIDQYNYLSPDKKLSASLGTRLDIQDNRKSLVWYNFDDVPTDVEKVIKDIKHSYSNVYKYDAENQEISGRKPLSISEQASAFKKNDDIVKIGRDSDSRLIVTTSSGESYYIAGDDKMQADQKLNSAVLKALTYFGKDTINMGDYKIPGIGEYTVRPVIPHSNLVGLQSGHRLGEEELSYYISEGIALPIKVGADYAGYRITMTDSETGSPVNIIVSKSGTIIDKLSAIDYADGLTPNVYDIRATLSGISNTKHLNSVR